MGIEAGKLWKASGYKTWKDYCRSVAGMSRNHAHRMMKAHGLVEQLKMLPRGNIFPQMEAQVRPLLIGVSLRRESLIPQGVGGGVFLV